MTTTASVTNPRLEAARLYVSLGWRVIPLHTPVRTDRGVQCSCRRDDCEQIGKHPRTRHGLKDGTLDLATIERWFEMWPDANVGICTGDGKVALDVDPRAGGDVSLEHFEDANGKLPHTPLSFTGSRGRHVLFATEEPIRNSAGLIGPGLDIRGEGGYIVAPPSLHACGQPYEWELSSDPATTPLAPIPPALKAAAKRRRTGPAATSEPVPETVTEGTRNDTLFAIACSMRAKGLSEDAIKAALQVENMRLCVPPLDEVEVAKIVASACKYKPGRSEEYEARRRKPPLRVVREGEPPPANDASPPPADDWVASLTQSKKGEVKNTHGNLCTILRHAEAYRGHLAYNEMRLTAEVRGAPLTDGEIGRIREALERDWHVTPSAQAVQDAIQTVAEEHGYHPVRQYLARLAWDGVPRIDTILRDVLHVRETPLARRQLRAWLISAVARAKTPGCKVDTVLVLIGKQGGKKSTFFAELAAPWFSDTHMDLSNKDAYLQLGDAWIYEWSEIEKITGRKGTDEVKAFLTSRQDSFRLPYGRTLVRAPRGCVVVGTTNEDEFLTDPTGSRRFWVLRVRGKIDIEWIRANKDQVWAEAQVAFDADERWWLDDHEEEARAEVAREHYVSDPWETPVANWLRLKTEATTHEILVRGLDLEAGQINRACEIRVGQILHRLGWYSIRRREASGHRPRVWVKVAPVADDEDGEA